MQTGDLDLQSLAMIGGFLVVGFTVVWIFLTLRQGESRADRPGEDREDHKH